MTFDDILEQVITLLKRQGRVSYGALKRRFALDDAYLNDLKDELLYVHPVVDDEGRGLLWTGEPESVQAVASQPAQPTQQPVAQEEPPTQAVPPREPRSPDAERRQLTLMFCDLVDSTRLSSQLDPEDWRDIVREYQRVCSEVIQRYEGHVAQLLGDGLLSYFGFPQAHEDDAHRAVRTGLEIINAVGALNTRLEQDKGITLAVRLGIHTGLVVVGAMGGAGRQEQLALGEVPNVAARIQGLAAPDSVVISDATYRLVQGYFEFQALGEQPLRGVSQPVPIYQVLQDRGVQSRLDVASTRGLTPLVGREQDVALLLERWEQAKNGHGQVVLLTGEGGIGKSRLVQVVKEHIADEPHTRWECRSSLYFQNTALYPLTALLQRALQWHPADTLEQRLETLEHTLCQYRVPVEESVPLFAPLLSLAIPEDRYPPLTLSPQRQRQKTFESLVAIVLELSERQPVLFILEDLHWTDPSTLEFLSLLVEQVPTAAIYTLLTCRPPFQPSWHHRSYLTEITVHRLSHDQIERVAEHVSGGKKLPTEVLQQIVEKTDGVPLFVEETVKAILETGHLKEVNGHYELTGALPSLTIPATLHDSLMARLDRLVSAKGIAQLGAVIGRQFSYDVLHAVLQLDEATLQRELGRLVETELVYQRGLPPQTTYTFKHALIQDAAYHSLLKSTRQQYHQRIAQVLEAQFPETPQTQPELLAHHYTEAGLSEQAVEYWHKAGQNASERSAYLEAIAHFTHGLAVLQTLPETPNRVLQELTLHIMRATPLIATKGWAAPEVEHAYLQAQALCQHSGEISELFMALWGLWTCKQVQGEIETARTFAEQCLTIAQRQEDSAHLVGAHLAFGQVLFLVGEFSAALTHLEQCLGFYEPHHHHAYTVRYGSNLGVFCLAWIAHVLWHLGYPTQALAKSHEACSWAQELLHPFSLALALDYAAMLAQFCREPRAAQTQAEAAIALCTEQGFAYYLAWGQLLRQWALTEQGQEEGVAKIQQGLHALRATGGALRLPYYLALLIDACRKAGHTEEGFTLLSDALTAVQTKKESWMAAELYRLKGALLLQQSPDKAVEAETCFQQSLDIAHQQHAKSWELRAATSLARLWQQQGKRDEARQVLGDVYGWFTEGFDTADLQDAKALLDELA